MIIEKLKSLVDIYFVFLMLFAAFVLFFIDSKNLQNKGLKKESKIAEILSLVILVIGPLSYIVLLIL